MLHKDTCDNVLNTRVALLGLARELEKLVPAVDARVGAEGIGDSRHGQGDGMVREETMRANDVHAVLDVLGLFPPRARDDRAPGTADALGVGNALDMQIQKSSLVLLGRLVGVRHLDIVLKIKLALSGRRHDLVNMAILRKEICELVARDHAVAAAVLRINLEVDVRLAFNILEEFGLGSPRRIARVAESVAVEVACGRHDK